MKQKVVITKDEDAINFYLDRGWNIVSTTAQHVAGMYFSNVIEGNFCFVIEKFDNPISNSLSA